MPISTPSFSSSQASSAGVTMLTMLDYYPNVEEEQDPPLRPLTLYGVLNGQTAMVEVFVSNASGRILYRCMNGVG